MSELTLNAQPREITGRKVRQLRNQGLVPVVVYGRDQASTILQVNARNFNDVLQAGGTSQLVTLVVDGGKTHNVLVRELQRHPVRHNILCRTRRIWIPCAGWKGAGPGPTLACCVRHWSLVEALQGLSDGRQRHAIDPASGQGACANGNTSGSVNGVPIYVK